MNELDNKQRYRYSFVKVCVTLQSTQQIESLAVFNTRLRRCYGVRVVSVMGKSCAHYYGGASPCRYRERLSNIAMFGNKFVECIFHRLSAKFVNIFRIIIWSLFLSFQRPRRILFCLKQVFEYLSK